MIDRLEGGMESLYKGCAVRTDRCFDRLEGLLIVTGEIEEGRWCFGTLSVSGFRALRAVLFLCSAAQHRSRLSFTFYQLRFFVGLLSGPFGNTYTCD